MATNNSINSNIPIEIVKGGTNVTSFATTDGVVYFDGTTLVTTAVGAFGDVLTSNGVGTPPAFQTASGTFNFVNLPATTALNVGTYQRNGQRFLHSFGTSNIFGGVNSGNFTLTGSSNTGLGASTIDALTSGGNNVAVGANALTNVTTGSSNVGVGSSVHISMQTGVGNVAVGGSSAWMITSGSRNVAIGVNADQTNVTGNENVCVGHSARSGASLTGTVSIGYQACRQLTSGASNTSVGYDSSTNITIGANNVTIGFESFSCGASSTRNTAVGSHAMDGTNVVSNNNTAIGYNSLAAINGADNNVCIGDSSGVAITTGNNNVMAGNAAFSVMTTGTFNIGLGVSVGSALTGSDSSNILFSNAGSAGLSNTIVIGTQGTGSGQQDTCIIHGVTGVAVGTSSAVRVNAAGQFGDSVSSKRYKDNIQTLPSQFTNKIDKLRPVSFTYKVDKIKKTHFGLIAEEVIEVIPELVGLDRDNTPHSVDYEGLIPMLLLEVQILKKKISCLETCLEDRKNGNKK
jgi:hypothetical protein